MHVVKDSSRACRWAFFARWTVCRLTSPPLPVFPARSCYEISTIGYGSVSKSIELSFPQRGDLFPN